MRKLLILLFSLNSLFAFSQNKEIIEKMIQGCLSDSTFKQNLLQESALKCPERPTYNIPSRPVRYIDDLEFNLTFNGIKLREHNYKDSSDCKPFQVYFFQKSKSIYEVSVSYAIFFPAVCEHLEGHGKSNGCFTKRIISVYRKIKIKKNGDWKIKETNYGNRIMTGSYL